jgi:hypothetical protein
VSGQAMSNALRITKGTNGNVQKLSVPHAALPRAQRFGLLPGLVSTGQGLRHPLQPQIEQALSWRPMNLRTSQVTKHRKHDAWTLQRALNTAIRSPQKLKPPLTSNDTTMGPEQCSVALCCEEAPEAIKRPNTELP